MFAKRDTEVLVVGAGPVGLYSALLLATRGIHVQIIDEEFGETTRSYALALHPRSLELLDEVGLTAELIAAGRRIDTVAFYGGGVRQAEIQFASIKSRYPFVLVLPQSALEAALARRLAIKGVEVSWSHRLVDLELGEGSAALVVHKLAKESMGYAISHTEWVVEKESAARVAFVLGADGHHSRVRRELGIPFDTVAPAQFFAIFEFEADVAPQRELRVILDEQTNVLWPLGDNRYRWSFEIDADSAAESAREKSRLVVVLGHQSYNYLNPTMLQRLIATRAPWFEAKVGDLAWSLAARFERRAASELGRGSAWLAGDAAHLAPPMGVQSMNCGLWEARELCERMFAGLRHGGRRDELPRFANEWSQSGLGHILKSEVSVVAGPQTPTWIGDRAARVLDCLPASGPHLDSLLAQLGLAWG